MARELRIRIEGDDSGWQAAASRTEQSITGLDTTVKTFGTRLNDSFKTGGLTGFGKELGAIGGEMKTFGTSMTVGITAPLAGIAAAAISFGADFERTMNLVGATSNASQADMKRLSDAAQEWGRKTKFSNTEAAQAMLELAKAGFTANETIGALPSTLQLATAADMSLADAATMTANVMRTFGHTTADLAHDNDVLVSAANSSTINVTDLRESLKFIGPVARVAGISLADVAAASSVLGGAGIKAEMAGTGLRTMLSKLLGPTKSVYDATNALGFSAENTAHKTVSWTEMLDRLHDKLNQGKDVADQYTGLIMKAFGQRAGPAVLAMATEGGKAIVELSKTVDANAGSAGKMADAYMSGVAGAMEVAKGSFETVAAQLLTSLEPTILKVLTVATNLANWFSEKVIPAFDALPGPVKTGAVVILGLVAAIGPLIVAAGMVASGIAALIPLLPAIGTAIGVLTGPIGLITAAVIGVYEAWVHWADIKVWVQDTYTAIKTWLEESKLGPILKPIIALVETLGKAYLAYSATVLDSLGKATGYMQDFWRSIEPVVMPIVELIESLGRAYLAFSDLVFAVVKKIIGYAVDLYNGIYNWLIVKLKPVFDLVSAFVTPVVTAYKGMYDKVLGFAIDLFNGVKLWLVDKFVAIVDGIKGKIDAVTGFFRDMKDAVVGHSYVPDMVRDVNSEFGKLGDANGMVGLARSSTASVTSSFFSMFAQTLQGAGTWSQKMSGLAAKVSHDFIKTAADMVLPGSGDLAAWVSDQIIGAALGPHGQSGDAYAAQLHQQWLDDAAYNGKTPDEWAAMGNPDPSSDPNHQWNDPDWMNTGFAKGSGRKFMQFGAGAPTVLHGDEAIVRRDETPTLAQELAAAMAKLGGAAGGRVDLVVNYDGREMQRRQLRHLGPSMVGAGI